MFSIAIFWVRYKKLDKLRKNDKKVNDNFNSLFSAGKTMGT